MSADAMTTDPIAGAAPIPAQEALPREVYAAQQDRCTQVQDPQFLDTYVRPHYRGAPETGGSWETQVMQLDGSGAATVRCALDGGHPVFAKIFPGEDGPEVYRKLSEFRNTGLGADSRYQSVEPLAWYGEHDLLLCEGAAGECVDEMFFGDRAAWQAAIGEAGAWLGRFHSSGLQIGTPKPLLVTSELISLAKRMAKAMAEYPEHLEVALGALKKLDKLTERTIDATPVQSHGQYRPYHVFASADRITVIDLDRSSPADPSRDVAEFIQRMRTDAYERSGAPDTADGATRHFLDAYTGAAPDHFLANFEFHYGRHLVHRLNRIIKKRVLGSAEDRSSEFLLSELDALANGRFAR